VIVEKIVESFGKRWKIEVVTIDKNIMANDLSYLNYNLEVKDETQLIYKRPKLNPNEQTTMHKILINKACEGVESLSKKTLHLIAAHDPDLQATC
jgi:hypothetical protein